MQSANDVPGVTGWKIHDDVRLELNDGNRRIYAEVKMITTAGPGQTNDEAAQSIRESADFVAVERLTTRVVEPVTAQAQALSSLSSRVAGQGGNLSAVDISGYITGEKPARQAAEQLRRPEAADIAAARLNDAPSAYDGDLGVAVRPVIR